MLNVTVSISVYLEIAWAPDILPDSSFCCSLNNIVSFGCLTVEYF